MKTTGIICEYNPLHLGHQKQLNAIRRADPDGGIVCLMSGNYVQRGVPAIFDKMTRAKAAILSGADLVLELPITTVLCSAEGFAAGGVRILSPFCDALCFGAETADTDQLLALAQALLSDTFSEFLKAELQTGCSFPVARQTALQKTSLDATPLSLPNNILAVEYCKAILSQSSSMKPHVILREGSYHDSAPNHENPSATALRSLIESGADWSAYVPDGAEGCFEKADIHALHYGENAILAKLRTMTDAEFEALPFGSEGLWRKLMHAARKEATLEEIIASTKSKRYTRTRIDRMILCAFLGITQKDLDIPAPYVRVLGLNDKGRQILKSARQYGSFVNAGEMQEHPYQLLENRCSDLYGLFSKTPQKPGIEGNYRIFYKK